MSNLEHARALLKHPASAKFDDGHERHANDNDVVPTWLRCPTCGAAMRIVERFERTPYRGRDPP